MRQHRLSLLVERFEHALLDVLESVIGYRLENATGEDVYPARKLGSLDSGWVSPALRFSNDRCRGARLAMGLKQSPQVQQRNHRALDDDERASGGEARRVARASRWPARRVILEVFERHRHPVAVAKRSLYGRRGAVGADYCLGDSSP